MARLKASHARKAPVLEHFRARSERLVQRFEGVEDIDLAPAEYLRPRRASDRLDAIEEGRPFVVGAWELPHGTAVTEMADNYTVHPDGRLTPWVAGNDAGHIRGRETNTVEMGIMEVAHT